MSRLEPEISCYFNPVIGMLVLDCYLLKTQTSLKIGFSCVDDFFKNRLNLNKICRKLTKTNHFISMRDKNWILTCKNHDMCPPLCRH